jgi:hypothetical protein
MGPSEAPEDLQSGFDALARAPAAVPGDREGRCYTRSITNAMPCPTPMHMVQRP